MVKEERLEIALSKKKIMLMLLGALMFVAIGLWFVIKPPFIQNSFFGNPVKMAVVGYLSISFFGLCAVFLITKLPDKRPGLIIDEQGLIDNSSGISAGQILWSDISDISVVAISRQKLILLMVKNPQEYIDKQKSGFKRRMMKMNHDMYGTPLSMTSNGLKIEFYELIKILRKYLDEAK